MLINESFLISFVSFLPFIFQIQGIYKKFKQPISYYVRNIDLNGEMIKIIKALQDIGLHVVVVVHDMGSNLISTKKHLGVTVQEPFFHVNGKKYSSLPIHHIF